MTTEVDINIQMNISIFSASNVTVLDFRRKKFCNKGKCMKEMVGNLRLQINSGISLANNNDPNKLSYQDFSQFKLIF